MKIFNLNFRFQTPHYQYDWEIEDNLSEATSNDCEDECSITIKDAIFIKGIDLYSDNDIALISNHPSIINVNYLGEPRPNKSKQSNLANWISVPIDKNAYYPCSDKSIILSDCKEQFATSILPNNSIASAIVTGVVALMLEAKPDLKWRDIKYILANTAIELESSVKNKAGYNVDDHYGFGLIDAEQAVKMAKNYSKDLGDFKTIDTDEISVAEVCIDNNDNDPNSAAENNDQCDINFQISDDIFIETITISNENYSSNVSDGFFSDYGIILTSPEGDSKVIYLPTYNNKKTKITINNFYGESSKGIWQITVPKDTEDNYFDAMKLMMTIYGTKTDISKNANP